MEGRENRSTFFASPHAQLEEDSHLSNHHLSLPSSTTEEAGLAEAVDVPCPR